MRSIRTEPTELSVEQDRDAFVLTLDGRILLTSIGSHEVRHAAPALLEHMVAEFMRYPRLELIGDQIVDPQFLGAYRLLGLQKEFIETGRDNLTENFALALLADPLLHGQAGPEERNIVARSFHVERWLERGGLRVVDLSFVDLEIVAGIDGVISMSRPAGTSDTEDFHRLVAYLSSCFQELTPEEQAAVVYLHNGLHGAVVHAIGLVTGELTPLDFAAGVAATQRMTDDFADVSSDTQADVFNELRGYAIAALDYVSAYRAGTLHGRVLELLKRGAESTETEFKSSLRWNLREERKDRAMTDAVVKTVAAFLNTDGGTLLIGVGDDRSVVGIEIDRFASDDDFLLHFYQAIQNALGAAATPLVKAVIEDTGRGKICVVDCMRGSEPFVCSTRQFDNAFFVRAGPRTENLIGAPREEFLRLHWGKGS
jgi:hypothetical protein